MSLTPTNTPYNETKKSKNEKLRLQIWNQHIDAIKSLMIERGIGSEEELSSQEKILFKVVQLVTSEDLLSNYPPIQLKGNETARQLHAAREKYRRGKQETALEKIKSFILGGGKWRNIKPNLERNEILKLILEHMQNVGTQSSATPTSPYSSSASTSSTSPAVNISNASQRTFSPTVGSTLSSSSQAQFLNSGSFPMVSPLLWNNSLPGILSSATLVPFVTDYSLYNSALQCFMLNSLVNAVPINVPTNKSLKVDGSDKSEEEGATVDMVGNMSPNMKNKENEYEEIDIIN